MRLRFGECLFDTDSRELRRRGEPVHLTARELRLLELLLSMRPRPLSKEELHHELWTEAYVSDASITNMVGRVRAAIGDEARKPSLLRTIHGFGYAFNGVVECLGGSDAEQPATVFRLIWGQREIALHPGENILGRVPEAVAWVHDDQVSRRHARIIIAGGEAILEDLGSKNGTLHRGERVHGAVRLSDGDDIRLGLACFVIRIYSGPRSTATNLQ